MSTGWLLPFITLNSGSELWKQINHNPTSRADVVALVLYFRTVFKRLDTQVTIAPNSSATLWRFPYPAYQRSRFDNAWKQAEWLAAKFSRPGYEIEICYNQFHTGVGVVGDRL